MTWGAIVGAVVTAGAGAYQANRARRDARSAANASAETADPWAGMRGPFQEQLLTMLPDLLNFDDSSFEDDAGFQFEMNAGTEAINNSLGSQRLLRSGTRPLALTKFASGLAHSKNQQRIQNKMEIMKLLAGLGGANSGSPAAAGQLQFGGYQQGVNQQNNGINAFAGAMPALANGWNSWVNSNNQPANGGYGQGPGDL